MKITIHRGIDQIGGCITEIATDRARILIDLGQNLPDGEGVVVDDLASREAIAKLTAGIDAIFYTHYHGDHLGLFHYVPDTVAQYIGRTAKRVALCKHKQLAHIEGREAQSAEEIATLERMRELIPQQTVRIGDITVTPYFVSHSAYDAYMFAVEAGGKHVLHTGDFRGHGYLSKGLLPTIKKLILPKGSIDFLIIEGTMLSRQGEKVKSEHELQQEVAEIMGRYKNVFILCSSTDMERLATFYAANKRISGKPFVCDRFQKNILEIFSEAAGAKSSLFRFDKAYDFRTDNQKLIGWMQDKGFCMLVRATDKFTDYYHFLEPQIDPQDTVLIYSMWKEYLNPERRHAVQRYLDFVSMFSKVVQIHTSGHASDECLVDVCNLVNPAYGIIPIHSERSDNYRQLNINDALKEKIITASHCINGMEIEIIKNCKY